MVILQDAEGNNIEFDTEKSTRGFISVIKCQKIVQHTNIALTKETLITLNNFYENQFKRFNYLNFLIHRADYTKADNKNSKVKIYIENKMLCIERPPFFKSKEVLYRMTQRKTESFLAHVYMSVNNLSLDSIAQGENYTSNNNKTLRESLNAVQDRKSVV